MLHWCTALVHAYVARKMVTTRGPITGVGNSLSPACCCAPLSPARQAAAAWRLVRTFRCSAAASLSHPRHAAPAPTVAIPRNYTTGKDVSASLAATCRRLPSGSSSSCSTCARPTAAAPLTRTFASARSDGRLADPASAGGVPLPEVDHISSTANNYVKHLVKLRTSSRYRREQSRCLLVGSDLIAEAAGAGADLQVRVLLQPDYARAIEPAAAAPPAAAARPRAPRPGAAPAAPRGEHGTAPSSSSIVGLSSTAPPAQGAVAALASSAQAALLQRVAAAAQRTVRVGEGVMKKVSGLESVAGLEAVAELDLPPNMSLDGILVERAEERSGSRNADGEPGAAAAAGVPGQRAAATHCARVLVLDGVQDPGNLGTLARSALAFGWDALYLLPGCVDPYNDKAVRASRGALLRLPTCSGDLGELWSTARRRRLVLLSADLEEDAADLDLGLDTAAAAAGGFGDFVEGERSGGVGGICLVLGSEGQGLSAEVRRLCTRVSIPMEGQMESLNVGVAGGILMFALSRGALLLQRKLPARIAAAAAAAAAANVADQPPRTATTPRPAAIGGGDTR